MPTMSPVRACQIIARLLRRLDADDTYLDHTADVYIVKPEEHDALRVLHSYACGTIVRGDRRP